MTRCYQVNLQTGWGGGEMYTAFFTRALLRLGTPTTLFVHANNPHWAQRLPAECKVIAVAGMADIAGKLPGSSSWLLFHTPAREAEGAPLRHAGHFLSAIAHMPLYGREPAYLRSYHLVYAVSAHVIDSLHAAGIHRRGWCCKAAPGLEFGWDWPIYTRADGQRVQDCVAGHALGLARSP